MNKRRENYKELIQDWFHKIESKKIQPDSYFQRFQIQLSHMTLMEIDYDRSIVPVIIHKMLGYFTNEGIPSQNPSLLRKLSILLLIVQALYNNMFINKQDVGDIVAHLKISDKQVNIFLQSTIQPIEIRWESCIAFQMDVFWFIIAYKDVNISLLVQLYEKTVKCVQLKDNIHIYDYYKSLKRKLQRKQQKLKEEQLQMTTSSSKNNEQLMNSSFDFNISLIPEKSSLDSSSWSLDFE